MTGSHGRIDNHLPIRILLGNVVQKIGAILFLGNRLGFGVLNCSTVIDFENLHTGNRPAKGKKGLASLQDVS